MLHFTCSIQVEHTISTERFRLFAYAKCLPKWVMHFETARHSSRGPLDYFWAVSWHMSCMVWTLSMWNAADMPYPKAPSKHFQEKIKRKMWKSLFLRGGNNRIRNCPYAKLKVNYSTTALSMMMMMMMIYAWIADYLRTLHRFQTIAAFCELKGFQRKRP